MDEMSERYDELLHGSYGTLVAVGVPKKLKGGLPGPALAVPIGLGMGGI